MFIYKVLFALSIKDVNGSSPINPLKDMVWKCDSKKTNEQYSKGKDSESRTKTKKKKKKKKKANARNELNY